MTAPDQYECKECGANWAEYKAKDCIQCRSKNIIVVWYSKKKRKK